MKRVVSILLLIIVAASFAGCQAAKAPKTAETDEEAIELQTNETAPDEQDKTIASQIEGVSDEVYQRGITFIEFLEATPMVGQQEGEDMLNAIALDSAPDSEALFEDVIYILWIYHNLKCMDSAAEDLNETWRKLGKTKTVQEEYADCRDGILNARSQDDLWEIWNVVKE